MHFRFGLRFPFHSFIRELLHDFLRCAFRQLVPNLVLSINTFIAHWSERKIRPNYLLFFKMFKFQKSLIKGLYWVQRQNGQPELVITHSSNKGWHEEWVYIRGDEVSSLPFFVDSTGGNTPSTIKYKIPPRLKEKFVRDFSNPVIRQP